MDALENVWIPLVDEPIGSILARIEADDPELATLVDSPRRLLAFRTFAYIRVGIVLGQLLMDEDVPAYDGSETWVEALLRDPRHYAAVQREVRTVADEVAGADERDPEPLGPDEEARDRFRRFARSRLGAR